MVLDRWGPWLALRRGPFLLRAHLLLPPVIAALACCADGLASRYSLLLGSLALHEGGHAAAALLLGSPRAEISIWPVFGRALVGRLPDRREGWVAVAGPAVNLVLALGLFALGARPDFRLRTAGVLDLFLTVNLLMGAGNLLPIPPADGGRALAAFRR